MKIEEDIFIAPETRSCQKIRRSGGSLEISEGARQNLREPACQNNLRRYFWPNFISKTEILTSISQNCTQFNRIY